jgi:cytochrome c-type biogenesis protein CcsB
MASYVLTIILLSFYALLLATATFIEKYYGTETAKIVIYYAPFFIFLQLLMILNFIAILIRKQLLKKKKMGFIFLHISFIIILLGAFTSHISSEEGTFHIREGETSNQMLMQNSKELEYKTLPFSLELAQFTISRYPGSSSPSSFESRIIIHENEKVYEKTISMNNVLDINGYRFFQASYDADEAGTILFVNKDKTGRNITYTGYALLLIGFILCFTGKNALFRQLNNQLKEIRTAGKLLFLLFMLVFPALSSSAKEHTLPVSEAVQKASIDRETAAAFGALPLLSNNGRIEPVNTFSSEVLRKLHKSDKIGNMNSDQFLLSVLTFPEIWMHIPLITVSNPDLALFYDLTKGECAYSELFENDGTYKLSRKLREAFNKAPAERSRFDKDILKLDEQINIFYQLINKQLLNIFPNEKDQGPKWYAPGDDLSVFSGQDSLFVSEIMIWYTEEIREAQQTGDWSNANEVLNMIHTYQQKKNNAIDVDAKRIKMELLYNQLEIFRFCKKCYFILGGIVLILSFISFLKQKNTMIWPVRLLIIGIICSFLYHLFGIGLRGYISGYAPWSNSYETMVYVSWVTILAGLFFVKRNTVTFALSTLFGGIILFVSGLNWMDPQINPLVPVLKSPWLMFHVAVIVAAYGFAGVSCLVGFTNLILMMLSKAANATIFSLRIQELSSINAMSVLIGLALMSIGTFIGAIWANESWGRYWGWDPKETWALITMVVYAITIHLKLVKFRNTVWLFNLMSVLSFFSVLMTYLGVNYFLSGMHSYGANDSMQGVFIYLFAAILVVIVVGIFSYRKSNNIR